MKRMLIVVGALVVIAVVAVIIAFATTGALPKEADAFLSLIEQERFEEAYQSTAEAFRHETSEEIFVSFISRTLLTDYERASWSSRSIENRAGRLEGAVRTKGGGTIPLTLEFVKEGDAWKILSLEMGDAGFVRTGDAADVPPGEELVRITNRSIQRLGEAINARDFDAFYNNISKIWRRQTTAHELHQAFGLFTAQNIDLLPALEETPVYSEPPNIGGNGVLTLIGYYPVEPKPINFSLEFVYEHPKWKLLGINVRM